MFMISIISIHYNFSGLTCGIGLIYEEEVMNNWSYLRVVLFVSGYCSYGCYVNVSHAWPSGLV